MIKKMAFQREALDEEALILSIFAYRFVNLFNLYLFHEQISRHKPDCNISRPKVGLLATTDRRQDVTYKVCVGYRPTCETCDRQ